MTAAWAWAGARAVGTSHLAHGMPCQDAFACTILRRPEHQPVLIAALADGAGSAELAEVGATLATSLVVEIAQETLTKVGSRSSMADILRYAVSEARTVIEFKAEHDGRAFNDYAATLLVAILSPIGGAVGQIGDGAAVIDDGAGGWRPVHWPDHGEYVNTTSFLTQPDALDLLRVATFEQPVRRIALFSDGLERLLLDFRTRAAHGPFFDSIFHRLPLGVGAGYLADISDELAALLVSEKVNVRTDDDKSLLCAALVEA